MALNGMTPNCIDLDKDVIHVINCCVIVVLIVCPLIGEVKRLVEAS